MSSLLDLFIQGMLVDVEFYGGPLDGQIHKQPASPAVCTPLDDSHLYWWRGVLRKGRILYEWGGLNKELMT